MESAIHNQKIIMPLEEALELGSRVIKTRGMSGITGNQSDEYHYRFLDAPDIIVEFPDKRFLSEQDSEGYNREYVGYVAYLTRINQDKLEVVGAGCLRDHPLFTEVASEEFSSKGLRKLAQSANAWFEDSPWLEKEKTLIQYSDRATYTEETQRKKKLYVKKDEAIKILSGYAQTALKNKGYELILDENLGKQWRLSVLSVYPFANYFHLGVPESIRYKSGGKPYAVLNYNGQISLENQILRDLVNPKSLGNGVIVMNENRIPKYLKRTLGLGENRK